MHCFAVLNLQRLPEKRRDHFPGCWSCENTQFSGAAAPGADTPSDLSLPVEFSPFPLSLSQATSHSASAVRSRWPSPRSVSFRRLPEPLAALSALAFPTDTGSAAHHLPSHHSGRLHRGWWTPPRPANRCSNPQRTTESWQSVIPLRYFEGICEIYRSVFRSEEHTSVLQSRGQ